MKKRISRIEFETRCHVLLGKRLWRVTGGVNTGTVIALDFGKHVTNGVGNSALRKQTSRQVVRGELDMLIGCAWRVEQESRMVCGSGDSNEQGGIRNQGLQRLEGTVVQAVEVGTVLDFKLRLSGGLSLNVFRDYVSRDPDEANYWIRKPNGEFLCVRPDGSVWLQEEM